MKTLSKLLFLVLLALPSFALAQGVNMGGTSGQFQGGGLSRAAADTIYLRLDATNDPLTGALSSSNGTYSATGAAVALVLESAFTPTAGADVPVIIQSTGDFGAADSILSVRDNTSTVQFSVRGNGDTYLGGTSLPATLYFDGGNGGLTYTNVVGARNIFFLNTSYSNAGTNMVVYSGANAAGEYGVVAGSNATTTAQTSFAVCNNCLNTSPTMVFEVLGTGDTSITGDFTVTGGQILNAGTAAGINLSIASGANLAGEYGVVVGSNDTATGQTNFAVANDIDGTPVYVLEVDGLGNTGIGIAFSALSRLTVGGTHTVTGAGVGINVAPTIDATNAAVGINVTASLDAGDTLNEHMIFVGGTAVADAGETHPQLNGLSISTITKSGTGTFTEASGIRVVEPTAGASNYAILVTGSVVYTGAGSLYSKNAGAGVNLGIASFADALGEYGAVVGTNATTTAQQNFAVANDIDGTPVYVFTVFGTGKITQPTCDKTGVPGAGTCDTPTGRAAVAAAAGSVLITNALVSTTSIVNVTLQTNDAACHYVDSVVLGAGSFTVNVGPTICTGNTNFGFTVVN
mgnify:CR=1 FL=1